MKYAAGVPGKGSSSLDCENVWPTSASATKSSAVELPGARRTTSWYCCLASPSGAVTSMRISVASSSESATVFGS